MSLNDLVVAIQGVLADKILIVVLVGAGLWFTFNLGFIQVRGFGEGWKRTFGGLFKKSDKAGKEGMSSFQALATAIAAQVGTGNLAGAATAIAMGGPGGNFLDVGKCFLRNGNNLCRSTYGSEVQTGRR